ncbi:uncharacterized protein E5676_scaffold265G00960 [Cucumis melo var. makuwa]|uniref:Uncharacterized protein n=1 Tax=Cucumis melo var. makuwa TaxID=1194695 RepID=A0A5D3C9X2_CUCMM|nr:uncharacterized protein E5676_scaffold265G00960 [Cucumis melo var. makuwa]
MIYSHLRWDLYFTFDPTLDASWVGTSHSCNPGTSNFLHQQSKKWCQLEGCSVIQSKRVWDVPEVDDAEDQQLIVAKIIVGHRVADHVEDGTLCRVDVNPTVVERPIVRDVDDDFINDEDE